LDLRKVTLIYLLILIILFGCIYFIEYQSVYNHERTHELINDYYGCYNIETKVNWDLTGHNKHICILDENKQLSNLEMHSMNEIVSYNLSYIKLVMYLFMFLLVLLSYINNIMKISD
jgi:hypothetical protein